MAGGDTLRVIDDHPCNARNVLRKPATEPWGLIAMRIEDPTGSASKCGCRSGLNSVTAWRLHGWQRRSKRSCKNLEYAARQFQGREAFKVGFQTRVD
jgi:hypothetical protein